MSRGREVLTYRPGDFFERGALNVTESFRKTISKIVRNSKYSREQIVEMIDLLTGVRITKQFFNQTTSKKKEYRFPAEVLHAFCFITGSLEPFKVLLNPIGCDVVGPKEAKELRLMRLLKEKERIEREIKLLKEELYE